jgi:hypothetical protein
MDIDCVKLLRMFLITRKHSIVNFDLCIVNMLTGCLVLSLPNKVSLVWRCQLLPTGQNAQAWRIYNSSLSILEQEYPNNKCEKFSCRFQEQTYPSETTLAARDWDYQSVSNTGTNICLHQITITKTNL